MKENCWKDTQQRCYTDRIIRGLIGNTGEEQKEIENDGRKEKQENKELWKQSKKKMQKRKKETSKNLKEVE